MGRHRRSAAGRAATGRATGITETHPVHTESYGPENLYGYAMASATPAGSRSHRRRKKTATPVRNGLLGVSAAVALGTVAVATGVLPGSDNYALGGGSSNSDKVQAIDSPSSLETQQGGTSGTADDRDDDQSTSRDSDRASSPSASPSSSAPTAPSKKTPPKSKKPVGKPSKTATKAPAKPSKPATKAPKTTAPVTVSAESAAEAEVLKLVNVERSKVGCSPVAANSALSDLASAFSEDMAARGFFDHTDPSGATPWDRAAKAGITSLGGENIARGQADAAAVMEAWMNSPGHRANILNCDFKTLGVGVHMGSGGPWWTQDFGY
ncbi:CAP domain-containing protein [Streptomyces sp. SAS_270]|uniref:CAP domain-containing protein n=1 Tax=Streptomyces sp. SAS_270 TaxID=3412748 RepID=UPI00403C4D20